MSKIWHWKCGNKVCCSLFLVITTVFDSVGKIIIRSLPRMEYYMKYVYWTKWSKKKAEKLGYSFLRLKSLDKLLMNWIITNFALEPLRSYLSWILQVCLFPCPYALYVQRLNKHIYRVSLRFLDFLIFELDQLIIYFLTCCTKRWKLTPLYK